MSREAEKTLFGLLIDLDEITSLAMEGLPFDAIPSTELHPILEWALKYFHQSGRAMPPTVEAFKATKMPGFKETRSMYDVLSEYDIFLGDLPEQHMLWAIEELKATYLKKTVQDWSKETSRELTEVPSGDTHGVLAERATELVGLSLELESHQTRVELRESSSDLLADYEVRKLSLGQFQGMHFGLQEVDEHTNGIYPGELAVVGAFAKVGKSYFVDRVALKEWEKGRSVALFTLENSLQMTRDRIACLATGIDPRRFEMGIALPDEERIIEEWVHEVLEKSDTPLFMLSPEGQERSAEQLVLKARLLGVDSLIIDQLTFVEADRHRDPRHLQIRQIMHDIKNLINSSRTKMPCLIAHQINREGIKRARKDGHHIMEDMAEGSEVERTGDWVFSMFQDDNYRAVNEYLLQVLAARRRPINNWLVDWVVENGHMSIQQEIEIG